MKYSHVISAKAEIYSNNYVYGFRIKYGMTKCETREIKGASISVYFLNKLFLKVRLGRATTSCFWLAFRIWNFIALGICNFNTFPFLFS